MPEPVEEPEEELAQGEQAVVGEAPVLEVSANLRKVVQYREKAPFYTYTRTFSVLKVNRTKVILSAFNNER